MSEASDLDRMPIQWRDVGSAIQWAEDVSSRPDVRSATGIVIQSLRGTVLGGAGDWSAEDWRDLAHTVMSTLSGLEDAQGREALRAVYCMTPSANNQQLAQDLAVAVSKEPVASETSYSHLSRVARAAITRAKSGEVQAKPYGMAVYAWALGIERRRLYDGGWMPVIRTAEQVLAAWRQRGERAMETQLQIKGLMS